MERVEFFVIVVFVFIVVVGATAVDMQFGLTVQAQQHAQWQITTVRLDDLDRWRQFLSHLGTHGSERLGIEQVGLVEDHQVGAGQLVGEQFVQRRFMIQVGVELALLVHLIGEGGKGAGDHCRAVYHGNHRVDRAGVTDFWPVEGLYQRFGQRQAAGLDEDMVEVTTARHQFAHHWEEFFLHGAAQATVGQLEDTAIGFFFTATDGALLEDLTIDAQLAELVDDHRDTTTASVGQQMAQQRGFTGTEKSGDDGDRQFGEGFHEWPRSVGKFGGRVRAGGHAGACWPRRITPSEQMAGNTRQVSWLTVCALRVLHLPAVEQWCIEGFKTVHSCGGSQGIDPVPS